MVEPYVQPKQGEVDCSHCDEQAKFRLGLKCLGLGYGAHYVCALHLGPALLASKEPLTIYGGELFNDVVGGVPSGA